MNKITIIHFTFSLVKYFFSLYLFIFISYSCVLFFSMLYPKVAKNIKIGCYKPTLLTLDSI